MLKVFLHIPSPPDFLQVCAKKLDLGGGERGGETISSPIWCCLRRSLPSSWSPEIAISIWLSSKIQKYRKYTSTKNTKCKTVQMTIIKRSKQHFLDIYTFLCNNRIVVIIEMGILERENIFERENILENVRKYLRERKYHYQPHVLDEMGIFWASRQHTSDVFL